MAGGRGAPAVGGRPGGPPLLPHLIFQWTQQPQLLQQRLHQLNIENTNKLWCKINYYSCFSLLIILISCLISFSDHPRKRRHPLTPEGASRAVLWAEVPKALLPTVDRALPSQTCGRLSRPEQRLGGFCETLRNLVQRGCTSHSVSSWFGHTDSAENLL